MVVREQKALAAAQAAVEADDELRSRLDEQQKARGRALFTLLHACFDPDAFPEPFARLVEVNAENVARLVQITDSLGWPGRSLVGEAGADGAWITAQHADRRPELRDQWIPMLATAVAEGEADPRHLACLVDRQLLCAGSPQLYGTVFSETAEGVVWPEGLEEPKSLDGRRAAIGLVPFAQDREEAANGAVLVPCMTARTSPGNQWPARKESGTGE